MILLLVFLPVVTGCEGCRRLETADEAAKKNDPKEKAPVDAFTMGKTLPLPSGGSIDDTALKPGHWFTLRQPIRSNHVDQRGDLIVHTSAGNGPSATEHSGEGVESLSCQRPAVLPKGRMKRLDTRLLAARENISMGQRMSTSVKFTSPFGYTNAETRQHMVMHGDEYFFAILTRRREQFATLQVADWIRPPFDLEMGTQVPSNYRVVFPQSDGLLALPDTMLDWTADWQLIYRTEDEVRRLFPLGGRTTVTRGECRALPLRRLRRDRAARQGRGGAHGAALHQRV